MGASGFAGHGSVSALQHTAGSAARPAARATPVSSGARACSRRAKRRVAAARAFAAVASLDAFALVCARPAALRMDCTSDANRGA